MSGFSWKHSVKKFQHPETVKSITQLGGTLMAYFVLCYLMWRTLSVSYGLTLLIAIVAAGFLLKIFIIFHDCTHGSFFKSLKANIFVGRFLSLLIFTPYRYWQAEHAYHHATSGNLDKRGKGDIWTMTVREYCSSPRWKQWMYRIYRHPFTLFVVGPPFFFLIRQRLALGPMGAKERRSVYLTDLSILGMIGMMSWLIGLKNYFLIQLPVIALASCGGVWLFYVQHQFQETYWRPAKKWDYVQGALQGSSYYKLPKILQWFSGNIGFHHIHHLSPKIPNYRLEQCHHDNPDFQKVKPLTLLDSFKTASFCLWDEETQQMVGWSFLKEKGT